MLVHGTDCAELGAPLRACAHHVLDDTYATFLTLARIQAKWGVVKPSVPTVDEVQRVHRPADERRESGRRARTLQPVNNDLQYGHAPAWRQAH